VLLAAPLLALVTAAAPGTCPSPQEILDRLPGLGLDRGSRKQRFGMDFPREIHEHAASSPGKPFVDREGMRGFSAIVVPLPVAALWKAVNDEDHHALDGGYVPVKYSAVVGGTPHGDDRLVFQCFQRMGIGRWWTGRVRMNRELFTASQGQLWELYWQGEMDGSTPAAVSDPDGPCAGLKPLRASEGAWLLAPLSDQCTFVEHYTSSESGGVVGAFQPLVMSKALRDTLEGIVRLARDHVSEPHPGPPFLKPDGTPLE